MPGFDLKQVSRNDKGVLGAGIVAFIASFLPYYGVSYNFAGIHESASVNAWHGYAILGLLLVFAAALIVAARVFANANLPQLPVGVNLLAAGLAGLGTLLIIVRGFTYPHASGVGGSVGVKWGGYVLFIVCIAETVFLALSARDAGEKLAWDASALNRPAAAAPATGYAPPAGYAVPPAQPAAPAADQPTAYPSGDPGSPTA